MQMARISQAVVALNNREEEAAMSPEVKSGFLRGLLAFFPRLESKRGGSKQPHAHRRYRNEALCAWMIIQQLYTVSQALIGKQILGKRSDPVCTNYQVTWAHCDGHHYASSNSLLRSCSRQSSRP